MTGVVSLVLVLLTVGTPGAVVSTNNSEVVVSTLLLPAASVTVAPIG